jgi:hypothetical protein
MGVKYNKLGEGCEGIKASQREEIHRRSDVTVGEVSQVGAGEGNQRERNRVES